MVKTTEKGKKQNYIISIFVNMYIIEGKNLRSKIT